MGESWHDAIKYDPSNQYSHFSIIYICTKLIISSRSYSNKFNRDG